MKLKILITGGAGFIGSFLSLYLKQQLPHSHIIAFDNLSRRGSELNIPLLQQQEIEFIHGDIRNSEDLHMPFDILIECSANPSILSVRNDPYKNLQTNLVGSINCFEQVRVNHAAIIFLSTSRVYSIHELNNVSLLEQDLCFDGQGFSVNEHFSTASPISLYGASKLSSEKILQEYAHDYHVPSIINRCGLIAGPGQFGKSDQGVVALWVAQHLFQKPVTYVGYQGKQVRDILHVEDLCKLIYIQVLSFKRYYGEIFNVGGGAYRTASLKQLTNYCTTVLNQPAPNYQYNPTERPNDIKWYVTNNEKVSQTFNWQPNKFPLQVVEDIAQWMKQNTLVQKLMKSL